MTAKPPSNKRLCLWMTMKEKQRHRQKVLPASTIPIRAFPVTFGNWKYSPGFQNDLTYNRLFYIRGLVCFDHGRSLGMGFGCLNDHPDWTCFLLLHLLFVITFGSFPCSGLALQFCWLSSSILRQKRKRNPSKFTSLKISGAKTREFLCLMAREIEHLTSGGP